jgi:NADPH-dependent 2,4-dienoyl-CoA reductase/sulfur reductase-like enzyme
MKVDVLIAGAGPAGLAAAIELRRLGVGKVLVVDREQQPGGIPRHSVHTGFGLRDLHRLMTGPAYARHYSRAANLAGAVIRTGTTVTDWPGLRAGQAGQLGPVSAALTSPNGRETVTANAVLLATGCRERPRPARLVPGGRPPGVMTTGELQQRVYLEGQRLPGRAVVIGAEHVSFSALVTLAHAGADVVALVTDQPRHQSLTAFRFAAQLRWRVPVWTRTAITGVIGGSRLEAVELRDLRSGAARLVPCDTVVFTGDWIPDHELARQAGTCLDAGTRGPAVDTSLRTSVPRVYAAGNLVHAAETADVAALAGRHAARQMAAALHAEQPGEPAEAAAGWCGRGAQPIRVRVAEPLVWIAPNAIGAPADLPPRERFLLRASEYRPRAHLVVHQDGRLLARARTRLLPGRSIQLNAEWAARVDPQGGPVFVGVR